MTVNTPAPIPSPNHADTTVPMGPVVPVHYQQDANPELEDRLDVAGFKVRRSRMPPFGLKYEASHPMRHGAGDDATGVVVIDLDDIAPASSSHGAGAGGAHISTLGMGAGFAGLFLALYLGAKPAFEQIGESLETLKELREDRGTIKEQLHKIAQTKHPLSKELRRNAQALLSVNRRDRNLEYVKGTFAGALAGSGMSLIGVSILLGPNMFGLLSPALAAAAGTMLAVGAVVVPVFCSGMIGYEGYRLVRAHRTHRHAHKILEIEPLVGNEKLAYKLLKQRIRRIEAHAVGNALSFAGLGVGAPLTTFLGPIGLSVLLPSVVGIVYASYYHGKQLHYTEQLAPEQKMRLGCEREIMNRIELAETEYLELKDIKSHRRLFHPFGVESPTPVRLVIRAVAALRRRFGKKHLSYPSSQAVMFDFMVRQSAAERDFVEKQIQVLNFKLQAPHDGSVSALQEKQALALKLQYYQNEQVELAREHQWLTTNSERQATKQLPTWECGFDMLRFIVRKHLIKDFTEQVLEDKKLHRLFRRLGLVEDIPHEKEVHMDANLLVDALCDTSPLDAGTRSYLHDQIALLAERTVLRTEKNRAQYRKRELLDALGELLAPKPALAETLPVPIPPMEPSPVA